MTPRRPGKNRIWWLLPLVLLVLLAAALIVLGGGGLSARFDDPEAILAAYDPASFEGAVLERDGTVTLRLGKEDLYWFGEKYGLLPELRSSLTERGWTGQAGFRLADGRIFAYFRHRVLGLLPVTYRAELEVSPDRAAGELVLRMADVRLGSRLPLPAKLRPRVFSTPLRVSLGAAGDAIRSIRTEGDTAVLVMDALQTLPAGELRSGELLGAARLFGPGAENVSEAVRFLMESGELFPAKDAWRVALQTQDVPGTLAELLALCDGDSLETVRSSLDPLMLRLLEKPFFSRIEEQRQRWDALLSERQQPYERALYALREMAKSGGLRLTASALVNASSGEVLLPGSLAKLPATATDSRFVLVYSASDASDLCAGELPPAGQLLPRETDPLPEGAEADRAYELGAALTTDGGVPVLLYRGGDGSLRVRQLDETAYVSILVARSLPVVDLDGLPPAALTIERPSGEGWNGAVLELLSPAAGE